MLVLTAQIVAIYNLACKDTTFFLYVQIFSNIFFSLVLDLSTTLSFFHPFPHLSPHPFLHLSPRPFLTLSLYFLFLAFLILFLLFLYSFLIFLHSLIFIPIFLSYFPPFSFFYSYILLFLFPSLSFSISLLEERAREVIGGRSYLSQPDFDPFSTRYHRITITYP